MKLLRVVQYADIFPEQEENQPMAESLLKGINREHLCNLTSNLILRLVKQPFLDDRLNPRNREYDFLTFFLSDSDPEFIIEVKERFRALKEREKNQKQYDYEYVATGKASVMTFQRMFFSLPPTEDKFDNQTEKNFFKALLIINQQVYDLKYDSKKHENEPIDLKLAHLYLANSFANEDVDASDLYDAFRRQLVKSVELFTYLCRDRKLKKMRELFYAHFRIGNWGDYIIPHIMSLHWLKQESGLLEVQGKHISGRKARRVLKRSAIEYKDIIPYSDNEDYKQFRGKPFVHLGRYRYAITNPLFVVEHIYNSVYFELKKYRKDVGFMDDDAFRVYFTTEFSQKFMFHKYARLCLNGKELNVLDGVQCDEIVDSTHSQGVNPLDFYARYDNGCVFFEFKDTFLSSKLKDNRDAEKFFKEIKNKFVEKQDGTPKGIGQLMKNVKAIQEGSFIFDDLASDTIIYPVLVVDNYVYTMRAMHTKLEYLMREYCHDDGIDDSRVKPLILVDVATLRLYSDYISSEGYINVFEEYYKAIQIPDKSGYEEVFNSMMSFSEFMKGKKVSDVGSVVKQILNQVKPYFQF